ncbi:MAG: hypothetical protein QOD06_2073 [Candidatus Binatota bacterium]|nr:hypothetical protein [Candidatus Binatota bacterium]
MGGYETVTEPTRPILWNVPDWFREHFVSILGLIDLGVPFLLFGAWIGLIAWGLYRWLRLPPLGTGSVRERLDRIPERLKGALFDGVGQRVVVREPSGIAHLALYVGFVGLFAGTALVTLEFDTALEFYSGTFFNVYKLMMDVFGILLVNAAAYFLVRRLVDRPRPQLDEPPPEKMLPTAENLAGYTAPLTLLLLIGLTGFLLEGARIAANPRSFAGWGFVGASMGAVFRRAGTGTGFHATIWWVHIAIVLSFLYTMMLTKLRHMFIAPLNLFFRNLQPRGRLAPIKDFENAEKFGVSQVEEYNWKILLDMAACLECGRCTTNCPTVLTGKTLNPKKLVMTQREHLLDKSPVLLARKNGNPDAEYVGPDMITEVATEPAIWGCTTCGWCEEGCPVKIEHIQRIVDMRRHDVMMEGRFPEEAATAFKGMETQMNPWGLAYDKRAEWAEGLEVPLLSENPNADVLYWVGCAGSYDQRNQKVSKALVSILKAAGVNFAILGPEEACTGDPARRLGNEYLFATLAQQNIETLNRYQVKTIVTQCPHCFHTIANEYPDFGGKYQVVHTGEYVAELIAAGRIRPEQANETRVVYHDPCYMGRHNGKFEGARESLGSIPGVALAEIDQSKRRTVCCGAGGGCFWKEEHEGTRINLTRVAQLETANPETIAVGCPFCMTMIDDAVKAKSLEEQVRVRDLVEMVAESLPGAGGARPAEAAPEPTHGQHAKPAHH